MIPDSFFAPLENELGFTCDGYSGKCTCQAVYVVRLHKIDNCTSMECGVHLLCPQCTLAVGQRIGELLLELHQISGEDTTCLTCEKPLAEVGDMFVVENLRFHRSA